jgi:EAL domain-containing protein (putative c-di-GMP-specific phosphodiesterase class I)
MTTGWAPRRTLRHRPRVRAVLAHPRQLRIALQPVVRLDDLSVVGYEALARFPDQARPPTSVPAWFAAASRQGLGPALESLALRTALERRALVPVACYLTANVSAALVNTSEVRAVLEAAAPLDDVVIELTEQHALEAFDQCRAAASWLRTLGGRIAIDDVGAGYSGLQWLIELEPEIVKVDMALIRGLHLDPRRRTMTRSIATLGRELGAVVVAEGIEEPAELAALRELGVPCGQGFLLGRPVQYPLPATGRARTPRPAHEPR